MAHFVVICRDRPDALELRLATRAAHQEYLRSRPGVIRLGGAFRDEEDRMIGSVGIIEADGIDEAREFVANDPNTRADLFESVEIHAWAAFIGEVP